jgi:hypothetical protein
MDLGLQLTVKMTFQFTITTVGQLMMQTASTAVSHSVSNIIREMPTTTFSLEQQGGLEILEMLRT